MSSMMEKKCDQPNGETHFTKQVDLAKSLQDLNTTMW